MSELKTTPWGLAEQTAHLGNGVLSLQAPGHGRLFIPDNVFHKIAEAVRKTLFAETTAPGANWAEGDCDLPIVMPFIFDGIDEWLLRGEFPERALNKDYWIARAREIANHFEQYKAALPELERLEQGKHR